MERIVSVGIIKEHVPTTAGLPSGLTDMDNSRSKSVVLAIIGVVGLFLYFTSRHSADEHKGKSVAQSAGEVESSDANSREFLGYECTADCSGHEAGYKWAEEHDITDGEDCDTAGEHSNSPSFAEGCHAYVNGESEPEEAADPDNEQ